MSYSVHDVSYSVHDMSYSVHDVSYNGHDVSYSVHDVSYSVHDVIPWLLFPSTSHHHPFPPSFVAIFDCCPQGQGHSEGWNLQEISCKQSHNGRVGGGRVGDLVALGDKPCYCFGLLLFVAFC